MAVQKTQVRTGMEVLDSDGAPAGKVSAARADDFLLDRSLAPDVYIPYSDVQAVVGNAIKLNLTSSQIDDLSWDEGPPAAGKA